MSQPKRLARLRSRDKVMQRAIDRYKPLIYEKRKPVAKYCEWNLHGTKCIAMWPRILIDGLALCNNHARAYYYWQQQLKREKKIEEQKKVNYGTLKGPDE